MDQFINFLENNWWLVFAIAGLVLLIVMICSLLYSKKNLAFETESTLEKSVEAPETIEAKSEQVAEETVEIVAETQKIEEDPQVEEKELNAFIVVFDRAHNDWVIRKKGATRATRRAKTKKEAMVIAKELTKKYNSSLSVKKKDGKFQKLK